MSNPLKTDEKAILSVLLYQFLHEKSTYSSFKEFNKVVRDNFISLDDLEFWFTRFENGKFDERDDDFSISDFKSMLSDDKHRLRACIFFEFLKEIRMKSEFRHDAVFAAYKRMSKVLDIDYSEFDFCFYRFMKGVFNLDFEYNPEQIRSFSDLPFETVKIIVGKLNFPERCCIRKLSFKLRNIVDDTKIGINQIDIRITKFIIAVNVEKLPTSRMEFKYYQIGDICVVDHNFRRKQFKGNNCLDLASNDLSILLNTSKICSLNIKFADIESFVNFENVLTLLNTQLHVENLSLHVSNAEQVFKILSYLKPGTLKSINVYSKQDPWYNHEMELRAGLKMDQWRQAKVLVWHRNGFPLPLEQLFHFRTILAKLPYVDSLQLQKIKEALLKLHHIKYWYFRSTPAHPIDDNEMDNLFGPITHGVRHLEIPNTNAHYEITATRHGVGITKRNH
ncbi:hypothetical protein B9Z55_021135 [Caenorhabditis nigoni]|uniref:F-box domain-containing protein n=1 Tax=Caenorhabditis nigoni TaxID=1611254 RepID=A0A2G5TR90_9PELO|nr:hypothetical protein B9Z55_021135 [Caenorhabditis nigoni]